MNDRCFMQLAIEEAKKSKEKIKCGVVIVKNGKIIAKSYNSQKADKDSSAHAEIKAIREAGKIIHNRNLTGSTIYCTCEPCLMCFTACVLLQLFLLILKNLFLALH